MLSRIEKTKLMVRDSGLIHLFVLLLPAEMDLQNEKTYAHSDCPSARMDSLYGHEGPSNSPQGQQGTRSVSFRRCTVISLLFAFVVLYPKL
jgi:hypothetical protein